MKWIGNNDTYVIKLDFLVIITIIKIINFSIELCFHFQLLMKLFLHYLMHKNAYDHKTKRTTIFGDCHSKAEFIY